MPRYFLHIRTPEGDIVDPTGSLLSSSSDAREEAINAARGLLAVRIKNGRSSENCEFYITDESSELVSRLPLRNAVPR